MRSLLCAAKDGQSPVLGPEDERDKQQKATPRGDDSPTASYRSPPHSSTPDETQQSISSEALRSLSQRYELLNEVGRGGMGVVYRARDRETGGVVALKVLLPEISGRSELIERFKAEMLLARKVTHKNVCRTHELLRFGDTVAISMEYVEGESLRAFLKRYGSVPLRKGLEWTKQICSALGEAHGQGVVHRDLKPENILIASDGTVKVMDFGLARSVEGQTTQSGTVMGTPAYMSPEQAQGKPVDHRSDIYSLGLILYEMFTGTAAFTADTVNALLYKHVHETPPSPDEVEPYIPAFLNKAILKCLEKDAKKRFPSATALEDALIEKAAPTVPPEPKEEELPVPLYLTRWQRIDYALLAAALLGAVLFVMLFEKTFPYSLVRLLDKKKAEQIAMRQLSKLDPNATWGLSMLFTELKYYAELAAMEGPSEARRELEVQENATSWYFSFWKESSAVQESEMMSLSIDQSGRLGYFSKSLGLKTSSAMESAQEQRKDIAARFISKLTGDELSVVKRGLASVDNPFQKFKYSTRVSLDPNYKPLWLRCSVNFSDGGGYFFSCSSPRQHGFWDLPKTDDLAGLLRRIEVWIFPILSAFAVVLFFLRHLHRRGTSIAILIGALLAATLSFAAFFDPLTETAWEMIPAFLREIWRQLPTDFGKSVQVTLAAALFVLLWVLGYFFVSTARYYVRKNDPDRIATLSGFRKAFWRNSPAGAAILRGLCFGLGFAGGFVSLLALGNSMRLIFPDTHPVLAVTLGPLSYASAVVPSEALVGLRVLTVCFVEAFVFIWLLLVLPMALLRRATPRPTMIVCAVILLWALARPYILTASTWPDGAQLATAALAGLGFSWIYLRRDLLTAMVAIFTLEIAFLGTVCQRMFHSFWSPAFLLPFLIWLALALFGFGLYFRPQLVAAYQRTVAVFE